ncbi:MAG: hypothetical protein ABI557_17880, partial [Aureliella sp.]
NASSATEFSPTGSDTTSIPSTGSVERAGLGHLTALSSDLSSGLGNAVHDTLGLDSDSETLPANLNDPQLAHQTTATPFPDRTNPFEFGKGVEFDAPQARESGAQTIQLYGFAGSEHPKAIIRIDGTTKMLSAGEKWGVLEVLEVSPPTVRIKANGVARVWSLLGHHEQTGL